MPIHRNATGLLVPTVFTAAALFMLVSLGAWQWQRMQWKNGIIAALQQAGSTAPRDYASIDTSELPSGETGRYVPVAVTGRFENDKEVYVFWTRGTTPGYLVLTPFRPNNGQPLLVNRGFVPERLRRAATRAKGQIEGEVTLRGLLVRRGATAGLFTPDPVPDKRIWYRIAPGEISDRLGLSVLRTHTLDADETANPGGWPKGRGMQERISAIPNRHFEYALTWWGLALTLVAVYSAYVFSRPRQSVKNVE